jgi:RND family efflux transporter MFP subunit
MEDIESARANLKQAEAILAVARDRLRKSRLLAPCDGVVAFRNVEEGEVLVIPPAVILTQVVNLDRLKVRIAVGEKDIGILARQKHFSFTVDALPGEIFWCRVAFVSPVADPATRAFPVEFSVDDPDPRMADGMTARVTLPLVNEKKTIKVPTAWLSEEEGKIGLYVAQNGEARFRVVTLGAYYDQRVEILSGVSDNERVITNPSGLKGGDPIRYE